MKKIIILTLLLLCYTFAAFAQKQEWIDKNYNFKNSKRILVIYDIPENLKNGITENETAEIFMKNLLKVFRKNLNHMALRLKIQKMLLTNYLTKI